MTLKLRNPWIDPRVEFVRPEDAQSYLVKKGWIYRSRSIQGMLIYHPPTPAMTHSGLNMTAIVPEVVAEGAPMERLIEMVATIASYENRYAGDVLNDLLMMNKAPTLHMNGVPAESPAHAMS